MHKLLRALSVALEKSFGSRSRSKKKTYLSSARRQRFFETLESRELLATSDWLGNDWQYRSSITVPSGSVVGANALVNFPLLIDSTQEAWRATTSGGRVVNASGADFAFTMKDGATRLDYEIEAYDPTTGHLTAWVQIPQLSPLLDTTIYTYYGNAVPNTPPASGNLWSEFASVYHFAQDPVAAASLCGAQACDSTANGHNLSGSGMLASDSVAGKLGNALSFGRKGTGLDAASFAVTGSEITLSAWIRADSLSDLGMVISLPYSAEKGWDGFDIYANRDGLQANLTTNVGYKPESFTVNYADGAYHHIAAVYDGASVSTYFDGRLTASMAHTGVPRLDAQMLNVGYPSKYWGNYVFKGQLDEVRVAEKARSAAWLKTEYVNQGSPSSFTRVGSEEFRFTDWSTRVRVEVDNTGLNSALQNYQVMVEVPYRQGMRPGTASYLMASVKPRQMLGVRACAGARAYPRHGGI